MTTSTKTHNSRRGPAAAKKPCAASSAATASHPAPSSSKTSSKKKAATSAAAAPTAAPAAAAAHSVRVPKIRKNLPVFVRDHARPGTVLVVPAANIAQLPAAYDEHGHLYLCAAFAADPTGASCPAGAQCPRVHVTDITTVPCHQSHKKNAAWARLSDVPYARFPSDACATCTIELALPNTHEVADVVSVTHCLVTRALESERRPMSHCAHFTVKGECDLGSACHFVHCAGTALIADDDEDVLAASVSAEKLFPTFAEPDAAEDEEEEDHEGGEALPPLRGTAGLTGAAGDASNGRIHAVPSSAAKQHQSFGSFAAGSTASAYCTAGMSRSAAAPLHPIAEAVARVTPSASIVLGAPRYPCAATASPGASLTAAGVSLTGRFNSSTSGGIARNPYSATPRAARSPSDSMTGKPATQEQLRRDAAGSPDVAALRLDSPANSGDSGSPRRFRHSPYTEGHVIACA